MTKSKVKIKSENKNKFTKLCTKKGYDGVTNKCIEEGLASKSAGVRKMAVFAKNAKGWKK